MNRDRQGARVLPSRDHQGAVLKRRSFSTSSLVCDPNDRLALAEERISELERKKAS
jgi:hypothetical protein